MKRRLARLASIFGVFIVLFLVFVGETGPLLVPMTLLTGWVFSVARLVNAWHPATEVVAMAGLGVIVLLAGSHAFIWWLASHLLSDEKDSRQVVWSWKWTLCGFGIAFCALLAIGAAMLTTHQIYWLSRSTEPWYVSSRQRFESALVAMKLRKEAEALQWDSAGTRAAFWRMRSGNDQPVCESIQPVWVERDMKTLRAVLLIPRRKIPGDKTRIAIIQPEDKYYSGEKLEALPQVLASFGISNGTPQTAKHSRP
jgi:hypothetical protein